MEKLIELAIKYDREKEWTSFDWSITNWDFENHIYQKYLISKEYWFIKWLVENDKIETDWILSDNLTYTYFQIPQKYYMWWCQSLMMQMNKLFYLRIVACLSIQDNPIDFLISILK